MMKWIHVPITHVLLEIWSNFTLPYIRQSLHRQSDVLNPTLLKTRGEGHRALVYVVHAKNTHTCIHFDPYLQQYHISRTPAEVICQQPSAMTPFKFWRTVIIRRRYRLWSPSPSSLKPLPIVSEAPPQRWKLRGIYDEFHLKMKSA